nr:tubulin--tyrosine ligase-like protein 12 [Ipomoea batatas]
MASNTSYAFPSDGCMEDAILQGCSSLEIYNSWFTPHFGEWALGFCAEIYNKDSPGYAYQGDQPLQCVSSLDLSNRCINNLFNKAFSPTEMPSLSHLNIHGNPLDQNSANDLLELLNQFSCLSALGPGKSVVDSMLLPRFPEWTAGEPIADRIINAMWLYLMTCRLADEEKIDETSVWFISAAAPFLYMPEGELASAVRTFDVYCRSHCLSNPQEYESYMQKLQSTKFTSPLKESSVTSALYRADGSALRVYTDIPHVEEFLNRPEFVIKNDPKISPNIGSSRMIKLWDAESPSNLKVFGKLLFYVSFGLELGIHTPTFDVDLSDFMDGDQPMSYEKAYKYFSRDPSQRWCCWNNIGLND